MRLDRMARVIAVALGLFFVVAGGWAFVFPDSFAGNVVAFLPYNRHLIHDIGSFQIGLGATLLFASVHSDALLVALSGVGVGAVFHALAHVIDRNLGGRWFTIPGTSLLAVLLLVGAGLRWRSLRSQG